MFLPGHLERYDLQTDSQGSYLYSRKYRDSCLSHDWGVNRSEEERVREGREGEKKRKIEVSRF